MPFDDGADGVIRVVPFGRAATSALAAAIGRAKQSAGDPMAPVTVVAPTNLAGLSARRLIGSGRIEGAGGLINVAFVSPDQLAATLAPPQLDRVPLTDIALVAAIRAQLAHDHDGFFAPVAGHRATEQALRAVYHELTGAHEATLDALAASPSVRTRAVVATIRAVRKRLSHAVDRRDVAEAATARVHSGASVASLGTVILYLLTDVSPVHGDLVRALGQRLAVSAIVGSTGEPVIDAESLEATVRMAPTARVHADTADPITITRVASASDSDDEVRCVLREVMALVDGGVPLDRIALLYTAADPYARIVREQLAAAGIAHNGPGVRRLADTLAGRTLQALLALDETQFSRDAVIGLVSGAPLVVQGSLVNATSWDRISRESGVVGGVADWSRKLERHRAMLAKRRAELQADEASEGALARSRRQIETIDVLDRFVRTLAAALHAEVRPRTWRGLAQWADELSGGLLQARDGWPAREVEALRRVRDALTRLGGLDTVRPEPSFTEFVDAVDSELDAVADHIGRFGDGVFFGPTRLAPGLDVDAVFVLGVAEGLCPAARREDALVPDRDRQRAIAGELLTRTQRVLHDRRALLASLGTGSRVRVLSFPRGDGRTGRARQPSRWLVDLLATRTGVRVDSATIPSQVNDYVTTYRSFLDGLRHAPAPLSLADRDLGQLERHASCGLEVRRHHLAAESAIARGVDMITARASSSLTRFDGNVVGQVVPALASQADAAGRGRVLSPSRLETWAGCPMRYFLGDVLRLAQVERPEDILTISALDRGSLLHTVLERFVADLIERDADVSEVDDYRPLYDIAATVMSEYEAAGLTGRPVLWQIARREILADLDRFVEVDLRLRRARGLRPLAVELSFGLDGHPPAVLQLADGRQLSFRGRIDRVDSRPGGASVYDYKTGSTFTIDFDADPVSAGARLQLPIYAAAIRQRFDLDDVDSYYWFTKDGNDPVGARFDEADDARVRDVLDTIVSGIEGGVFPAYPGGWNSFFNTFENCSYCDFDRLCPRDRGAHWEAKQDDPATEAFVVLRGPIRDSESQGESDSEQ
ncbi:MAG TPA: PD-(D/E)XK nuclease family protein [Acidimicrobiales bacterium]|nr:PD-(D/E)XK nuclease family protein [Acidimicrobiales bacterium]